MTKDELNKRLDVLARQVYKDAMEHYSGLRDKGNFKQGFYACAEILLPENERLREALEFYSDKASYGESRLVGGPEDPDVSFFNDVMDDMGETAREALEGKG